MTNAFVVKQVDDSFIHRAFQAHFLHHFCHLIIPVNQLHAQADAQIFLAGGHCVMDDLNMIGEIACLHRNFPEVPMNEIFTWASLNGACFLSKEDVLGSLSVGKRPGIVLVSDLDADGCVTDSSTTRRII